MSKRVKIYNIKKFMMLCFLFTSYLLWHFSLAGQDDLNLRYKDLYQIRMIDKPISTQKVDQMIKMKKSNGDKDHIGYTAWTQKGGITIENPRFGNKTVLDVIYFYGDKNRQFDLNLENGCGLSYETAFNLWGTDDIIGETIKIDERDYVVEKIWFDRKSMVVAKVDQSESMDFDVMDIDVSAIGAQNFMMEQVAAQNQIEGNVTIDYNGFISSLASFSAFPMWIVAVILSIKLIFSAYQRRQQWEAVISFIIAATFVMIACYALFGFPFGIPENFIPTKWSDFTFWEERFSLEMKQFHVLSSMGLYAFDIVFQSMYLKVIIFSILSSIFLMAGLFLMSKVFTIRRRVENGIHSVKRYCKKIWRSSDCCKRFSFRDQR